MTQNRDFFTPERVDEQVEQFSLHQPDRSAHLEPGATSAQVEIHHARDFSANEHRQSAVARLVKELQTFYQADYEQNRSFLARARQRIAAHQFAHYDVNQARSTMASAPLQRFSQERDRTMQSSRIAAGQSTGRKLSRSLGLLVAVLVAGLLVTTVAVVLTLNHGQHSSPRLGGAKARVANAPRPTSVPVGTILSMHKAPVGTNFGLAAWSPDGTRMAAPTIDPQTGKTLIYIWNTANGKDLLTVHLDVMDLHEVLWSPTGKYLALDNLQTIVIVDSQSGAVIKIINSSSPMTFNAPGAGEQQPWLTSKATLGSGFGFYSVIWSPDGAFLAVAISAGTTGSVVLLDPQTGAVKTTFSEQARPIGLSLSFSRDGKYLAVSYSNDATIVVWDVATQHVAFVLNDAQSMTVAWQPGTHNLARSMFRGTVASMENWDVDAQKLLKTYKGVSTFAWSPDGKELAAYTSPFSSPFTQTKTYNVTILNADTGAQIGPSISQDQMITSASWSPDGRTIAIDESSQIIFCAA